MTPPLGQFRGTAGKEFFKIFQSSIRCRGAPSGAAAFIASDMRGVAIPALYLKNTICRGNPYKILLTLFGAFWQMLPPPPVQPREMEKFPGR